MKRFCLTIVCILLTVNVFAGQPAEKKVSQAGSYGVPIDMWTEPVSGMTFVWVPEGTYMMGTPEGEKYDNEPKDKKSSAVDENFLIKLAKVVTACLPVGCVSSQKQKVPVEGFDTSNERPVHKVTVNGFWIGRTEVTQAQWIKIMGQNPSYFKDEPDHPVESISWEDTQVFIKKLKQNTGKTFRLPTEEEWEYAARSGGKTQRYSGGNLVGDVAWFRNNTKGTTHKVALKKPNGLGIFDMSGNVWEWCEDRYLKDRYAKKSISGYVSKYKEEGRVCRGGCYLNTWPNIRCSNRNQYPETYKFLNLGLRLVWDGENKP